MTTGGTALGDSAPEEHDDGSGAAPATDDAAAALAGAPPPAILLAEQTCGSAADCRTFQPGDWNPRVECCYEYTCDLDYVAVNNATWERHRAWQLANPFDCAEHLQEAGPCAPRGPRCGLVQDAPAAACVEGLCQLALPDPWPVVDPSAQRCTANIDCLAFRPSSNSMASRCCGASCGADWVAIHRDTATELDRWRTNHAPACDAWVAETPCPPATACDTRPPAVACRGGACVIDTANE